MSFPAPHGPEDSAPQYAHLFFNVTTHQWVFLNLQSRIFCTPRWCFNLNMELYAYVFRNKCILGAYKRTSPPIEQWKVKKKLVLFTDSSSISSNKSISLDLPRAGGWMDGSFHPVVYGCHLWIGSRRLDWLFIHRARSRNSGRLTRHCGPKNIQYRSREAAFFRCCLYLLSLQDAVVRELT